jgi:ribosomal protein L3 glutamine methyltransferase
MSSRTKLPATAREHVLNAEQRFIDAELVFGHGTDNARDEAVFLVFHVLSLPYDVSDARLDRHLEPEDSLAIVALIDERIRSRKPAAYLAQHMWFAGSDFHVDERVLVPRSPIAELINDRFSPWLDVDKIHQVLEIGTGSGCIAIATAIALPHARVDATDISTPALAVANLNLERYPALASRVNFIETDLFPADQVNYDLIITNPPYVPSAVCAALPPEYLHEPREALDAGVDGLDIVRQILRGTATRLRPGGNIVVDVGEMAEAVDREIPWVNFTWIDLHHGGEGIGIANKSDFTVPK